MSSDSHDEDLAINSKKCSEECSEKCSENCIQSKSAENDTRPGSGKSWSKSLTAVKFFCGNPSVERTEGIIHLYREE